MMTRPSAGMPVPRLFTGPRPDPARIKAVYDYREQNPDASMRSIARTLGENEAVVNKWLKNPARFDPYLDEIAIERALAGDTKVIEAFTIFEWDEFLVRARALVVEFNEYGGGPERWGAWWPAIREGSRHMAEVGRRYAA